MSVHLGRPAGYRRWPGRIAIALLTSLHWLAELAAGLATVAVIGVGGGVLLGALGVLLLVLYVGAGKVTP